MFICIDYIHSRTMTTIVREISMSKKKVADLSPLELEVMTVVWELGECTSAEVIEAFRRKRPLANTTIRTVLANIRKKGYLEAVPSVEPRVRFRPRVSKRSVARRSLRQLVGDLFAGSPRDAVAFLLEEGNIDEREMEEIRRLIEKHSDGGESK
jgi:BlaI family penicillinase repressor